MSERVQCDFCYHLCSLSPTQRGLCGVRENRDGKLITLGWGDLVASGVDPIEKKPMYHLLPGEKTFSFALFGCNFCCQFCQNHQISQQESPYWPGRISYDPHRITSPESLVKIADRSASRIMSYTYSDPVVWQDYMVDVAKLIHQRGRINCMVTNGSFSEQSLKRILPYIDAFNIDVKGDEDFYRTYCKGSLKPVMESISTIAADPEKVLEVTTLVIEGIHTAESIRILGEQLAMRQVKVWHLSRFFPHYRMQDRSPTSEDFLLKMLEIGRASGIPHIYAGNSSLSGWDKTVCPACKKTLIPSHSYSGEAALEAKINIVNGKCVHCGEPIYGRFD
ncbi:AmmeMemoRadiSam system radical SAM enzyme [Pleomorphochaeta sp. DL1XJH-081]|uniref:AmmeMemoRadiSam system radical SAM enzyme n=1 Tax=Pleomorphochaeta sp. DL1XJH-081 TaxID=3409690 RepID=UPI003BB5CDC5